MTADIKFGEQTVKLCGNAATSIRFKQIFRTDLLMAFKGMSEEAFETDTIKELAFVMNKQAQGDDFKSISFDDYVEWLEGFDESEMLAAAPDIINIWMHNTQMSSKSKKK